MSSGVDLEALNVKAHSRDGAPGTSELRRGARLIDRPSGHKVRAMREDPDRYFTVVRAQRDAQVRGLPIPADEDVR